MTDIVFKVGGGRGAQGIQGIQGLQGSTYVGPYAGLPAAAVGQYAIVTDIGIGGSLWTSTATLWLPAGPIVYAESNAALSSSGVGSHVLAAIPIPANLLRTFSMEVEMFGTIVGSTNSKTFSAGLQLQSGGTTFSFLSAATTTSSDTTFQARGIFGNRTTATQIGRAWSLGPQGGWGYSSANVLGTIDTSQPTNLNLKITVGLAGETMTIEAYKVLLLP